MGKVIASWNVKVTVREPDQGKAGDEQPYELTNKELEADIERTLRIAIGGGVEVNAEASRTDR